MWGTGVFFTAKPAALIFKGYTGKPHSTHTTLSHTPGRGLGSDSPREPIAGGIGERGGGRKPDHRLTRGWGPCFSWESENLKI